MRLVKKVREAVYNILTHKGIQNTIHKALLTFITSSSTDFKNRLITTDFDRLFEQAIDDSDMNITRENAPRLAPPTKTPTPTLTYLHGLLSENKNESHDHLVLSSGDFGDAYLKHGWGARFLVELFRHYTVCFIGYSLNDPVVRYITDAMSNDQSQGAFIFTSKDKAKQWELSGVTAITYDVKEDHSRLYDSLDVWSRAFRDGHKNRIVETEMVKPPPTRDDGVLGRLVWALKDTTAAPARTLSTMNIGDTVKTPPPFAWLPALEQWENNNREASHTTRTPVQSAKHHCPRCISDQSHTLTKHLNALMDLNAAFGDTLTDELAQWLARYLNTPALIVWIADNGARMSMYLRHHISKNLEAANKHSQTDTYFYDEENNAAIEIPNDRMRTLWNLVLTDKIKSSRRPTTTLSEWSKTLDFSQKMTTGLRNQLLRLLEPKITHLVTTDHERGRIYRTENEGQPTIAWSLIKIVFDCSSCITAYHFFSELQEKNPVWKKELPNLVLDFTQLLKNWCELKQELDFDDTAGAYAPYSVEQHEKDRYHENNEFLTLVWLVRDTWLAALENRDNSNLVVDAIHFWKAQPYGIFKRLLFFAAKQCLTQSDGTKKVICVDDAIELLLENQSIWLWKYTVQREVMRLLVTLAPSLKPNSPIERTILAGPPEKSDKDTYCDYEAVQQREILHHLEKINGANEHALSQVAKDKMNTLKEKYSSCLSSKGDDADEFPGFVDAKYIYKEIDYRDPSKDKYRDQPEKACQELIADYDKTNWNDSKATEKQIEKWRDALYVFSTIDAKEENNKELLSTLWEKLAPKLIKAPDVLFAPINDWLDWSIAHWLKAQAKIGIIHDDQSTALFFNLAQKLLALPSPTTTISNIDPLTGESNGRINIDPPTDALNSTIGRTTRALIQLLSQHNLKKEEGLPKDFKDLFTRLCDVTQQHYKVGRCRLAIDLNYLFYIDPDWTKEHLIPLLAWNKDSKEEAINAWYGYLYAAGYTPSLLRAIKDSWLATATHHTDLDDQPRAHYAQQFVAVALDVVANNDNLMSFSASELQKAMGQFTKHMLSIAAMRLSDSFKAASADGKQEEFFNNRMMLFYQKIWPTCKRDKTKETQQYFEWICRSFIDICIDSGEALFPTALKAFESLLTPLTGGLYTQVNALNNSGLCESQPVVSLELLEKIIDLNDSSLRIDKSSLCECLTKIKEAWPKSGKSKIEQSPLFPLFSEICSEIC